MDFCRAHGIGQRADVVCRQKLAKGLLISASATVEDVVQVYGDGLGLLLRFVLPRHLLLAFLNLLCQLLKLRF